jgi:quercetin dioxygenase-like cupin family protein
LPSSSPGIHVAPGAAVIPSAPGDPKARLRAPYATAIAFRVESDRPVSPTHDEGGELISSWEGFVVGRELVGPGGGEDWHMHQGFHDVVLHVVAGTASLEWSNERGSLVAGDFVYIEPLVMHRWSNDGDEPFEFVWFARCHEDRSSAMNIVVTGQDET